MVWEIPVTGLRRPDASSEGLKSMKYRVASTVSLWRDNV